MVKIQLNLYPHREIDAVIIEKLGLNNTTNPNALTKDLLYKLATQIDNQQPKETVQIQSKPIVETKEPPQKAVLFNKGSVNEKLIDSIMQLNL